MSFDRTEGLMTVNNFKDRFLLGINLTLDDGTPYPDDFFEYNLNAAISTLEHDLDILITPQAKVDKVDYRSPNYMNWNYVQLDFYPVVSIEKWKVIYPSNKTLFEYPIGWVREDNDKGVLRLFPDSGTIPQWMSSTAFLPYLIPGHAQVPHMYEIEYTAGFPNDNIPFILNDAIGLIASILPLDTAGDLIAGAGIANSSISLDGLSQTIGTTSSATNSGYGARILSYEKRLKSRMSSLRDYFKGIIFDSI